MGRRYVHRKRIMSAMGHPTPMSARFLGTGNQPTEANNLSSDALAALVSERLRATRPSRNSSTDSRRHRLLPWRQADDGCTHRPRACVAAQHRPRRTLARMNSELARAVAAAAAEPSGKLPPSSRSPRPLSTPAPSASRAARPRACSRTTARARASPASPRCTRHSTSTPRPRRPRSSRRRRFPSPICCAVFPPAPPNLDEAAAHLADGLRSGLPTCLPTRPRMAAALESPMSAGLFGDEPLYPPRAE